MSRLTGMLAIKLLSDKSQEQSYLQIREVINVIVENAVYYRTYGEIMQLSMRSPPLPIRNFLINAIDEL